MSYSNTYKILNTTDLQNTFFFKKLITIQNCARFVLRQFNEAEQ